MVIALGLVSVAVLALSQVMGRFGVETKKVNDRLEVVSIKNIIRRQIDCGQTTSIISGTGRDSLLLNKNGGQIFKTESVSGKQVMIFKKWRIWVRSFDSISKNIEMLFYIKSNNSLKNEKILFSTAGFLCK